MTIARFKSMKSLITGASFILALLVVCPALALVEFDVGYAGILSSSGGGNWTVPGASYSGAYGVEGDLRFSLPLSSWNFGLRYSQLGLNLTSQGQTLQMQNNAWSLLLGYRFIDTFLLLGPVATYAIANTGTLENTVASTYTNTATAGSVTQYTVGLEVGIKLPILIAAEVGYGNLSMSNFNNSQTLNGSSTNVSLSGAYARASVGLSF